MTLEQYAYLAEILAAVLIVPSLVYLAIQIRQSNAQQQASARYAFVEAMADINLAIAQSESTASVWRRGLASTDSLNDDELMQFWSFMGQYNNAWMVLFHLRDDGLLPDNQWAVVMCDVQSVMSSNGGKAFWKMGKG